MRKEEYVLHSACTVFSDNIDLFICTTCGLSLAMTLPDHWEARLLLPRIQSLPSMGRIPSGERLQTAPTMP